MLKEKDNQIYPINITNNYIKNRLKFNDDDYAAYFNLSLELNDINGINISGIVVPIEYFFPINLTNKDLNNKIDEYKFYFIEILINLLINISKLSDILILYDYVNDVLNIICTNYKKVLFTISRSNNTIVYKYNSNEINLYKSNNLPSLEQNNCIYINGIYTYFQDNPILNMSLTNNILELKTHGTDNYSDILSLSNNIASEFKIYMILFYAIFYYNTHLI